MSLHLAAALYIYIHYAVKEREKRAAVVAKATVHKQRSVQRFTLAGRREFSVGQWDIQGDSLARGPKLLCVKNCQSING